MYKPLRYLCYFLLFLASMASASAQPLWQVGVFGQYELDELDPLRRPLNGVNPGLFFGFELEFPVVHAGVYVHSRWDRLREDSTEIRWENLGTKENLLHDNLVLGPGIQLIVFPKKKMQVLLGIETYLGIPLRTKYEFFGPDGSSTLINFPSYADARGGAGILAGWQAHLGIRGPLVDRVNWFTRIGYGRGEQSVYWMGESGVGGIATLFYGGYVYSTLGVSYALPAL